ncbi:MAG: FAD-dependent oxidoreductase [Pseudomonadota bacterium]
MSTRYDIVVVGGGLTGAAAALALARDGWQVALVEAGPEPVLPEESDPFGQRVSTLNPAAIALLRRLDVWPQLRPERLGWFDRMTVWESDPELALEFSAADAALTQLGCVAENLHVAAALWRVGREHLTAYTGARVESLDVSERRASLRLVDGERLSAALVVAADGAGSPLRAEAGIEVDALDYDQRGVVATVSVTDHRDTAWQRFLPTGPLAFLPLSPGQASIVWTLPAEEADQQLAADDEAFSAALTDAAQGQLGTVTLAGPRAAFPLRRLHAERYHGDRVVLVGDAAHVVHPLAGQGANLGLLDAAALRDVLLPARDGGDPAAAAGLRRYSRWRRSDNEIMVQSLHGIAQIFGQDTPGWRGLRLLGARALNTAGWLRGRLVEHASGFGGKVPELARRPALTQI